MPPLSPPRVSRRSEQDVNDPSGSSQGGPNSPPALGRCAPGRRASGGEMERMSGSIRGFRFRFYPTLKQRRYLARAFGTSRYVFNWGLATKREAYAERQESIGFVQLSRRLTA